MDSSSDIEMTGNLETVEKLQENQGEWTLFSILRRVAFVYWWPVAQTGPQILFGSQLCFHFRFWVFFVFVFVFVF